MCSLDIKKIIVKSKFLKEYKLIISVKTRSVNFKESKMSRPIFYIVCHEEDKLIKQLHIFKSYDSHTQGNILFIVICS